MRLRNIVFGLGIGFSFSVGSFGLQAATVKADPTCTMDASSGYGGYKCIELETKQLLCSPPPGKSASSTLNSASPTPTPTPAPSPSPSPSGGGPGHGT